MGDPSADVLNDIDALLSKLKHLPGGARLNALSKLQECLVEITPNLQGENVTEAQDEIIDSRVIDKKSPRKGKTTPKGKILSTDKSNSSEIEDVVVANDQTVDEKISEKKINKCKRRLPSLPNWFNNFSDVPQFLTTQNRSQKASINHKLTKPCAVVLERKEIPDSITELRTKPNQTSDKKLEPEVQNLLESNTFVTKLRGRRKKAANGNGCEEDGKKCHVCNRTFINTSYLRIHMRKHTGEKPFKCEICDRKFTQKSSLWVHMKRHEGKFDHKCTECDYKSVLKIDLIRHMPKHTGAKVFICEQCGKMFTTDMRLKDHIRHVHIRNEKHVCDKCGFFTHRADNLRRHMTVKHSEDELFKCPICGDVLKQRWTFIVHLRRHTGERPHACGECGKGFKSLSQLAVHRRTHREGEHVCPSCDRKFKTKHHLVRHSIIHSGLKPYACSYCPYTCNVKGNINKHMKSVHKLNNFSFKTQNRDQNEAQSKLTDEQSAIERGQQVTEEFLQRISLRKDEQLTVEVLQQQLPKPVSDNSCPEEPVLTTRRQRTNETSLATRKRKNPNFKIDSTVNSENLKLENEKDIVVDPRSILPDVANVLQDSTIQIANNEVVRTSDFENNDLLFLSVKQCLGDQIEIEQNSLVPVQIGSTQSIENHNSIMSNANPPMIYVIRVVP